MRLATIDRLAGHQHGVVAFDQIGWSRSTWDRAIAAGSLVKVHANVARLVGTAPTELQRAKAATLAVTQSVASHRTAAVLWGLVDESDTDAPDPEPVHLIALGETRQPRGFEGIRCHRPRDRHEVRSVTRSGVPTTPPLRTLVDLGITDPHLVHGAVGRALELGLLTVNGIEAGLRRHSEHGRHGVVALRTALDDWAIDARPADSVLEVAFAELCARHALPPTRFHEVIEGWEVDFRFVGTPIIVECDGWTTHGRRRHQFEQDRRKDDDLRAAGWIPARVTYRAVTRQGADTARRLRRLLDRWAGHPSPDDPATALTPAA